MNRTLGSSGIPVSPLGLGCWAIGGNFTLGGLPDGWGEVDDAESEAAIHTALDMGVTFFDTADAYGTGHSEEVLGRAVKGRRHQVVIATKFGFLQDAANREVHLRYDVSPSYVRFACERSLRRLGTDYIDLLQVHPGSLTREEMEAVIDPLERLRGEGLIRAYGWSTGDAENAEFFASRSHAAAIQHEQNVFHDNRDIVAVCERLGLASINNTPLAMGLLSGKFKPETSLPNTDVRGSGHDWVRYFKDGSPLPEFIEKLDAIKEILTSGERTLVQGALAWLWARSDAAIPIPGFKTRRQVEELAGAVSLGPLSATQMQEIDAMVNSF
ncbi:aldo/keto reductase [Paenibacillus sp. PSB04]|uniref:aldo/keto reductase n=1 Tax=Paenibacillus sp. PSB04 TaxID=2866810 RepID=UPI0021F22026|nr:aldo/keto reductase [Paenibacillus sp. PSB04]UYO03161.1 aldo/keto reductase [Paenibacillus sp. PSB04]